MKWQINGTDKDIKLNVSSINFCASIGLKLEMFTFEFQQDFNANELNFIN